MISDTQAGKSVPEAEKPGATIRVVAGYAAAVLPAGQTAKPVRTVTRQYKLCKTTCNRPPNARCVPSYMVLSEALQDDAIAAALAVLESTTAGTYCPYRR
jgi:hypothetical protein